MYIYIYIIYIIIDMWGLQGGMLISLSRARALSLGVCLSRVRARSLCLCLCRALCQTAPSHSNSIYVGSTGGGVHHSLSRARFLSVARALSLARARSLSHTLCLSRALSLSHKRHLPIPRGCIWGLQRGLSTIDSEAPAAKLTEVSTAIQPN
jgi:hypothetical protein